MTPIRTTYFIGNQCVIRFEDTEWNGDEWVQVATFDTMSMEEALVMGEHEVADEEYRNSPEYYEDEWKSEAALRHAENGGAYEDMLHAWSVNDPAYAHEQMLEALDPQTNGSMLRKNAPEDNGDCPF